MRLHALLALLLCAVVMTTAQPESCLDGVCANGNECQNITTTGGTLLGPGCGCKVNTVGFDCELCIPASSRGGDDLNDDFSATKVRDLLSTQFIISSTVAFLALVCSIRGWSNYRNWHEHDTSVAVRYESKEQGDGYISPLPHAVTVRASKSVVFLDDITISHFFLLTGSVLYSVGIFTPKAFHEKLPGLFYNLTRQTDCEYFPGFVFQGLIMMILGFHWETCHQWRILSMTNEVVNGKMPNSEMIGKIHKALFESDRPGAAKWGGFYFAWILILVRWVNAKFHGTRSCCELLITSDSVDLIIISFCIAWLGLVLIRRVFNGFYLTQGYKKRPTPLTKDETGAQYAAWQTAVATFWGARGEAWSLFYLIDQAASILIGLTAFVFLILDAAAYSSSHNPGETEPSIKGLIFFFVFEAKGLIRLFVYHWNIRRFTLDQLETSKEVAKENAHVLQHASACDSAGARICGRYDDAWQAARVYRAPINDVPIVYSDPAIAALEYFQKLHTDECARKALKACGYRAGIEE